MVLALLLHGSLLIGSLILLMMTVAAAVTAARRLKGMDGALLLCFWAIAAGAGIVIAAREAYVKDETAWRVGTLTPEELPCRSKHFDLQLGAINAKNPASVTDPGPQDAAIRDQLQSAFSPPPTDAGGMPQIWSSFNTAQRRIQLAAGRARLRRQTSRFPQPSPA